MNRGGGAYELGGDSSVGMEEKEQECAVGGVEGGRIRVGERIGGDRAKMGVSTLQGRARVSEWPLARQAKKIFFSLFSSLRSPFPIPRSPFFPNKNKGF